MSARQQIVSRLSEDSMGGIATLHDVDDAEQLVDAHRVEVLAADGQAYDGELAMLRSLRRTLRAVTRYGTDMDEVRKLLAEHTADDAAARLEAKEKSSPTGAGATPDFFQPGRTYAYEATGFTAPELLTLFRVVADTRHPETGTRQAFGWIRTAEDISWSPYAEPADEWPACWTDVTEGGAADA